MTDLKSFRVWLRKFQDYEIGIRSQRDEWLMKRRAAAKAAMEVYMETKVGLGEKSKIQPDHCFLLNWNDSPPTLTGWQDELAAQVSNWICSSWSLWICWLSWQRKWISGCVAKIFPSKLIEIC